MMYLKRLWSTDQKTLSIDEAQTIIAQGGSVCAAISKGDEYDRRTTFKVENLEEVSVHDDLIIVRNSEKIYVLKGWDNNQRLIHVVRFIDFTEKKAIYDIKEAKEAILAGNTVKAEDASIRTGKIIRFEGDCFFHTRSGSVYRMI